VATARLAKGRSVLMLDVGQTLETENQGLKDKLGQVQPEQWTPENVITYKAGQIDAPSGAIRKFGSDFAICTPDQTFTGQLDGLGLRASHALGGLSNLWGASVLPSAQGDISDWPITTEDLSEHYQAVSQFMPVAGRRDAISSIYPEFEMEGRTPLPFTPQAEALLERVDAHGGHLGDVTVGAARNAASNQCIQCGMCLHGCPYDHIWSASHTLEKLRENERFEYRRNTYVINLNEEKDRVVVTLYTGETIVGNRLFVGAGVLETARLYLRSFSELQSLTLLDSQHFFTPFLHQWKSPRDPETSAFYIRITPVQSA